MRTTADCDNPAFFAISRGEMAGALKILMIFVFFAAGCLEIISILFRPISLSFRLYGNTFAGENMLETMEWCPGWAG